VTRRCIHQADQIVMEYPRPFDYHVSGWRSLWQRVSPFGRPPELPSLGDILMQSISIKRNSRFPLGSGRSCYKKRINAAFVYQELP
jgi:hypothetical protein